MGGALVVLDVAEAVKLAERLAPKARKEWDRLRPFHEYHRGQHADPYTPRTASPEYKALIERARTNLMPGVVRGVTQRLYVDGYRPSTPDSTDAPAWEHWQHNRMDRRQKTLYELGGIFGYVWLSTLRDESDPSTPVIRPRSPLAWYGELEDPASDVWPKYVYRRQDKRVTLVDDEAVYRLHEVQVPGTAARLEPLLDDEDDEDSWFTVHGVTFEGEPVCPFRYISVDPAATDDPPQGDIEIARPVQDRLNQTVFDLLLAQTYSSRKVRIISGIAAPEDPNGEPGPDEIEDDPIPTAEQALAREARRQMAERRMPHELQDDRIIVLESTDAKATTLPESNLEQLIAAVGNCIRIYGVISSTPPHDLLGELVNIAAEGLQSAETARGFKVSDRKEMFGEGIEDILLVAAGIAGDEVAEADERAQLVWRVTDPRSFGQTVDGLGKLAQMLDMPVEFLWTMVPGVTHDDIKAMRTLAEEGGPIGSARRELARQLEPVPDPVDDGVPAA